MSFDNASIIGISLLITLALLGAYLMLLQIRDQSSEKPDPKLTYLPRAEHDAHAERIRAQLDELTALVHHNAQQTASLSAQIQLTLQRVAELSTKLDRLQERLFAKSL
jgi:septal ring factor EnvC (AmiA/AmiB activator)